MNNAPNDPDVNQMMAVFDKLSRQADTAKDEMAMAVNSFVGRAQDVIIAKRAEIANLRAQLAERDATILLLRALRSDRDALIAEVTKTLGGHSDSDLLSLATTVAIGYQQWSDGHDAALERWKATGDAIMLCATGKAAPLSDSDVCGVIDDLRAQVATLTERLDRCTCTDDYGDIAE